MRGIEVAVAPPSTPGYDAVIRLESEWQTVQVRAMSKLGYIDMRRGRNRSQGRAEGAQLVAAVDMHTARVHLMRAEDADERMVRSTIRKRALPFTESVTCS